MKSSRIGVREGYVTVQRYGDQLVLQGLPVMGRSEQGELINRKVLISRKAPGWFSRLCYDNANTGFKIKVRIAATYKGHLAYAVPVARDREEALVEWDMIKPQSEQVAVPGHTVMSDDAFDYAKKAHEAVAAKNNLIVLEHNLDGERVRTTAIDQASGQKYVVSGGFIVSKLKNKIESGELDWQRQIELFVRARPLSS